MIHYDQVWQVNQVDLREKGCLTTSNNVEYLVQLSPTHANESLKDPDEALVRG